jgi:hypothetical protein
VNKCVGSVKAHDGHQPVGGGSIPAPTLHYWIDSAVLDAQELVERFHYSQRWPSNVQLVMTAHEEGGLFGTRGRAVAAVVYSIPPTRWSVPVYELARLVRRDDAPVSLSALIAASVRAIRKRQAADLLVSFADVQQGHHGGVYQASGWFYAGMRQPAMEGVVVDGVFVPGRSANSKWGTRSPDKLAARGVTALPKHDEGKHLYWRAVTQQGRTAAANIGLEVRPYPKPERLSA